MEHNQKDWKEIDDNSFYTSYESDGEKVITVEDALEVCSLARMDQDNINDQAKQWYGNECYNKAIDEVLLVLKQVGHVKQDHLLLEYIANLKKLT